MDILNELRSKAEERGQSLAKEQAHKEMVEHRYQTEIKPALVSIMHYLDELSAHIAFVDFKIPFRFEIPGYGPVKGLVLREHAVTVDSMRYLTRVSYSFECAAPEPLVFKVVPRESAAQCQAYLSDLMQKYTEWPVRSPTGQIVGMHFEVEFTVPVLFRFIADVERGHIVMGYANFEQIGTRKVAFRANQIDQDWLNKLGAFVLKRSDELVRLPVEEERLAAIRRNLAAEEEARRRELRLVEKSDRIRGQSQKALGILGIIRGRVVESEK